ncbi:DUF2851 family protein [Coraliomargarita sp. SDUM461004]|uniref:DUF2851 family protein n=1 Tax=Thalassobacterium sedimentorum TaxID=3041258 RepID=A0ABU1ALW8_9BACT|nr:DUF2851 family protein [Coraliomargarita sp. SDUM461004]MDQ8195800.1 DUF2851 family protein [Coraliomargarita sp. SDUM461004]
MKNEVQEIQGLYGPFSLSERVLQKIWLRGDFDQTELKTVGGRSLRVLDPGRWNLLEGPDFLEARLELGGELVVGDVEVHFDAEDWHLHGHGVNPNFNDVRLHVVLYANEPELRVQTERGLQPEVIYLMPLLERDLEDYAVEDALLELEQVEEREWILQFMQQPLQQRRAILESGARTRWMRKVDFAAKRLSGASWDEACHQYCLEVLGYARNRAPMSRLALCYTIDDFATERADALQLFEEEMGAWRLSGLRPANHPKYRLQQYATICRQHRDWPERLRHVLSVISDTGAGAAAWDESQELNISGATFRQRQGITPLIERFSQYVFSNAISSKRLNTLICDAVLPLGHAAGIADLTSYWQHWPAGDAPDALYRFLKQAQIMSRSNPFSNGQLQGGLHLLMHR